MHNKIEIPSQLKNQFCCPNCFSDASQGFNIEQLHCNVCATDFFALEDIPCLFPAGTHQRSIWQHQTAGLLAQAEQGLNNIRESLARYDLSDCTRERLAETYKANLLNLNSIQSLFTKKTLPPAFSETLNQLNAGDLGEYFDLIFRDWGWDTIEAPSHENETAFERTISLIEKLPARPKKILVLGAGAGRLSWDLHTYLNPEFTLAVDSNPLLLGIADELIKKRTAINFGEFKLFPQIHRPTATTRTITPPENAADFAHNWFLLGANVWNLPLKKANFDLVITPWFVDVNGGDLRDLIGLIQNLLTPEGCWLNTGPLLFTRHLPLQLKYSQTEIKEFIAMSGLVLIDERVDQAPYLVSPMEARFREEQVWSFIVGQSGLEEHLPGGVIANWLVMHHLPIPVANYQASQPHPLVEAIIQMIDGNNSINTICRIISPQLPENVSVKDIVVAVIAQLVLDKQAAILDKQTVTSS